jgi:uncharacterized membrane protein
VGKMEDKKIIMILFLVVSTILGATGQFLFKYAFIDKMLILTIVGGLALYGTSTIIYFYVLSRTNLSWAYGLGGIGYIVAVIYAATLLKEDVSPLRWIGVIVIVIGVVLISLS